MNKKILLTTVVAVLFIFIFSITNPVNAETVEIDAGTDQDKVKIETLTDGAISKNDDTKEVTIKLTAEELNKLVWYEKDAPTYDEDVERPGNGWWIGFRLTLPESVEPSKVTSDITNVFGASSSTQFNADDGKTNVCSYWLGIDENKLEGKTSEFVLATYKFHWDEQKTDDLTLIVRVNPQGVKLTKDPDKMVTVKVNDTFFTLLKGKALTDDEETGGLTASEVEKLQKIMTPGEGYKLVGIFDKATDKEFDLKDPISTDMELEVRFEKIEEPTKDDPTTENPTEDPTEDPKTEDPKTEEPKAEEPKTEEPKTEEPKVEEPKTEQPVTKVKDNTPKTGLISEDLFFIVASVLSLAGIVIYKKNNK